MYNFNPIAYLYSKNIKSIPFEYIKLIKNTFMLEASDNILDVGCGSGTITLPLSKTIDNVEGIDLSKNMIDIAKSNDTYKRVTWCIGDICKKSLKNNFYKLILSYETIHLIPDKRALLKKFETSLKNDGYFCVGFCIYNWEKALYKDILDIFNLYNIKISNWFFQKAEDIITIFDNKEISQMSPIKERSIKIQECWNAVEISNYIVSTSIFLDTETKIVNNIKSELTNMIINKYGYYFTGESEYIIKYSEKTANNY